MRCIRRAIDVSRATADPSGVKIVGALAKSLPAVLANERELQQVFMNLTRNAVMATGLSEVVVESRTDDERVTVTVRDNGAERLHISS